MRFNGRLKKWNAERGFGFVVADQGEQELFVHASAFPRDGTATIQRAYGDWTTQNPKS